MECNIMVLGAGGVGKSSLVVQMVQGIFPEEYDPTIEDEYRKQVMVDDSPVILSILDTAYLEEYKAIMDLNIRKYPYYLLMYSITQRSSFQEIPTIVDMIRRVRDQDSSIPMVLVGNKSDLESDRQVSKEEAEALAKALGGCPFFEISAKKRTNIEDPFFALVRLMRRSSQSAAKSKGKQAAYSPFKGLEALFKCIGGCAIGVGAIFILPIIFILLILIILPYQFVTVVFFPSTIEYDATAMHKRSEELDQESSLKKAFRVLLVGLSSAPMTFLLLIYPIIVVKVIIPAYGVNSYSAYWGSIGSFLLILLLLQIMGTIRHYISFEVKRKRLPDEDKPSTINWKNYKNWIILIGLGLEFIQIFTMPIKFAESVISAEGRKILAPFFLDVYLLADNATKGIDFSYYFSIAAVLALVVAVCIQSVMDLKKAYVDDNYKASSREEEFFFSFTGSMIYGHNQIRDEPKIGTIISVLADGLFIIVVSNLLNMVSCNYDGSDPVLVFSPSDQCWTDTHSTKAILSLICLGYYVPISILVGPMLTESGESKEAKDIKFRTSYMMVISSLKVLPFLVPVVFQQSQNSRLASALVTDILSTIITLSWIFLKAPQLQAPCTIPVINIWRSLPYIAGCLSAISLIAEIPQWGLLLLILIPVGMLLAFWTFRTVKPKEVETTDVEMKPS